jgi:hypothetical protein
VNLYLFELTFQTGHYICAVLADDVLSARADLRNRMLEKVTDFYPDTLRGQEGYERALLEMDKELALAPLAEFDCSRSGEFVYRIGLSTSSLSYWSAVDPE